MRQNIESNTGNSNDFMVTVRQGDIPQEKRSALSRNDVPFTVTDGLTLMLERLAAYFLHRAAQDDRETLTFCLYHLFSHIDALYCETLPALSTLTHTRRDGNASTSTTHMTPTAFRYTLWTRLQEMQHHIERVESLCHLLNRTAPRLLGVLDIPDEHSKDTMLNTSNTSMSQEEDTDRWQQIYSLLAARLNLWQERNEEHPTFVSDPATHQSNDNAQAMSDSTVEEQGKLSHSTAKGNLSSPLRPLLMKIDAALMLILDSAGAMFGDIVPDFQVVTTGDDEVVATLLFDLMQQADLLLMQCNDLFGPLQDLTRHYTLYL